MLSVDDLQINLIFLFTSSRYKRGYLNIEYEQKYLEYLTRYRRMQNKVLRLPKKHRK